MELVIKLFSRKALDRESGRKALAFLFDYGEGLLRPEECGVYEPFEPFQPAAVERYAGWLASPGGEFCFRRPAQPFPLRGCISNLLLSEIAGVPSPVLCTRWSLRMGSTVIASQGPEWVRQLLCESGRAAEADYGFVATDHDYRAKNFSSVPDGVSEVQQYIGENPEHGIPGLYWMNLFGAAYLDFFGRQKLAALSEYAQTSLDANGALCLRFGELPEDSTTPSALERQRSVSRILGEAAFFDRHDPDRSLNVPAALKSR